MEHYTLPAEKKAALILKRIKLKNKKDYLFVTVNPIEGKLTPQQFVRMIEYITKFKAIDDYLYSIETRGNEKGMHCHCLLHIGEGYRPDRIIPQIRNKFNNVVGNALHINIQSISRDRVPYVRAYIHGYKKNQKKKHFDEDKTFREKHQLEDIYSSI